MTDPVDMLKARLRADLKAAMQAKQGDETRTIRGLLAAIDNAQAVPLADVSPDGPSEVPRLILSAADLHALLLAEIEERRVAADEMARLAQDDRAATLRHEAEIVARYAGL